MREGGKNLDSLQKWIDFLCPEAEDKQLFAEYFLDEDRGLLLCMGQFRKFLREQGLRGNITAEELDEAIADKDYYILLLMLEELFLEPIPKELESQLAQSIEKYGITGQDIVREAKTGCRYGNVIFNPKILIHHRKREIA